MGFKGNFWQPYICCRKVLSFFFMCDKMSGTVFGFVFALYGGRYEI